ncbi:radical SAM protein [candidate division WOR-3 bacterium]|nr:radical SAM protein [candidate division WOR-3 bacterium]
MDKPYKNKLLGSWVLDQAMHMVMLYGSKYHNGLLRFIKPSPFSADIHVSTKCNSRCVTCDYWRSEARRRYPKHDLSTAQIEDIFTQLSEIGIKVVGLGGAEPLIRKDIGKLIRKAKEIVGGKVYLTTNGLLLERKAEMLLKSGVDHVSVSIDGIGDTNDNIRGISGDYERAIRGIRKLKELIETGESGKCVCNIGTTITQSNIHEIPKLIELARQLGTQWNFNLLDDEINYAKTVDLAPLFVKDANAIDHTIDYLHRTAEVDPDAFTLDPASLNYARKYLKDKASYPHCFLGYFRIYIDSFLNVYPGCILLPPVGNLRDARLSTIVESDLYRKRAEQMFNMECTGCTCGYLHNCMIEELPTTIKYFWKRMKTYRKYA